MRPSSPPVHDAARRITRMSARILVVDDDRDIRDLVTIKLESAGHDVITRADGAQALEAAQEAAGRGSCSTS